MIVTYINPEDPKTYPAHSFPVLAFLFGWNNRALHGDNARIACWYVGDDEWRVDLDILDPSEVDCWAEIERPTNPRKPAKEVG